MGAILCPHFDFPPSKFQRNSFNLKSFQREAFHLGPTTPRASSISFLFLAETNPSDSVPGSARGVWRFCPAPVRTQLQKSGFKSVHEATTASTANQKGWFEHPGSSFSWEHLGKAHHCHGAIPRLPTSTICTWTSPPTTGIKGRGERRVGL